MPTEWAAVQNEVNIACLRTCVKLLDRLELRPLDPSAGDDNVHVVSRLFIKYSNILLEGLEVCQLDIPVRCFLVSLAAYSEGSFLVFR